MHILLFSIPFSSPCDLCAIMFLKSYDSFVWGAWPWSTSFKCAQMRMRSESFSAMIWNWVHKSNKLFLWCFWSFTMEPHTWRAGGGGGIIVNCAHNLRTRYFSLNKLCARHNIIICLLAFPHFLLSVARLHLANLFFFSVWLFSQNFYI